MCNSCIRVIGRVSYIYLTKYIVHDLQARAYITLPNPCAFAIGIFSGSLIRCIYLDNEKYLRAEFFE